MPITDPTSYLPTMDEFIAHWSAVNAALRARGQPEAVLRDGCTLNRFASARGELETLFGEVKAAAARLEMLQEQRDYLQEELRARLVQFRDAILLELPESQYTAWMRAFPSLDVADTRYLGKLDEVGLVWEAINAEAGPLVLARGYTLTHFREDVRRFRAACRQMRNATRVFRELSLKRGARCRQVMDWLVRYRCAVRFELDVDQELLVSLPGRTPTSYHPR